MSVNLRNLRSKTGFLHLQSINLLQFKNYRQANMAFSSRIVGICGPNGIGKTNLLDAIYYLCFTKSYFGRSDSQHAQQGATGFRIEGSFKKDHDTISVTCILRENGKKEFLWDNEPYEKFAHHIGKLPCVIIAPDDVQIITGGSEERRRMLDALLSQLDAAYLQQLVDYNRVLQQRNSYLKSVMDRRQFDPQLMDTYDRQLVQRGEMIFNRRREFLASFLDRVKRCYGQIAGNDEPVGLSYESQLLQTDHATLLRQFREKDLLSQRTQGGIHRDDIEFRLAGSPFRNLASQGQRKSLLFALKLAEFETLRENKGFAPLLLLDDVFEKLDNQRMHNLLHRVCVENHGQIFITDTHRERIEQHFLQLGIDGQIIPLPLK